MIDSNSLISVPVFAGESEVVDPTYRSSTNYTRGYEPLETLPAAWYNSLMKLITEQCQAIKQMGDSMYAELKNAIEATGASLDPTSSTQLLSAIQQLSVTPIATSATVGGIISSGLKKNVLVNSDGTATVNALSDWNENTDGTVKEYIAQQAGQHQNFQFFPDYDNAYPWITAWTSSDGYIAPKNGWFVIQFSAYNVSGGASPIVSYAEITVNNVVVYRLNTYGGRSAYTGNISVTQGDVINICVFYVDSSMQQPILKVPDTSALEIGSVANMRFIPVKTVSDAPEIHATSATYLRPVSSSSTRVTADEYGNITGKTLTLMTDTEFDDGIVE